MYITFCSSTSLSWLGFICRFALVQLVSLLPTGNTLSRNGALLAPSQVVMQLAMCLRSARLSRTSKSAIVSVHSSAQHMPSAFLTICACYITGSYGGSWQKDNGAFAEYARFIAATCIVLPPDMTYEEGASLPGAHFTAVQVLYMRLGLPKPLTSEAAAFKKKDEKILIWGASTSVGHHAIQLAALSGLEVYATASLSAHEEVKALGASHVFDYRDQDAARKIQKAAGEEGIVYAIDCVCEKGSTDVIIVRLLLFHLFILSSQPLR